MTPFSLTATESVRDFPVEVYRKTDDATGDPLNIWIDRTQLAKTLGVTRKAIENMHQRHKERFDRFSTSHKMWEVGGKKRTVTLYNYYGILEACRRSNSTFADSVMDWLYSLPQKFIQQSSPAKILLLEDKVDYLEDLVFKMQKQLSISRTAEGSLPIQQVARKLHHEDIWHGNEWQLIDLLVLLGVIQKDPAKRRCMVVYKKYFDLGYFDWPCLKSGDPKPLIKSEVVLTMDGWNWLVDKLVAFQEEKTLLGHAKESRNQRLQGERFRLIPR